MLWLARWWNILSKVLFRETAPMVLATKIMEMLLAAYPRIFVYQTVSTVLIFFLTEFSYRSKERSWNLKGTKIITSQITQDLFTKLAQINSLVIFPSIYQIKKLTLYWKHKTKPIKQDVVIRTENSTSSLQKTQDWFLSLLIVLHWPRYR